MHVHSTRPDEYKIDIIMHNNPTQYMIPYLGMWAIMCVFLGMVARAMKLTLKSLEIYLDMPMVCKQIFPYLRLGTRIEENSGITITSYTKHFKANI